jgi:hypothetical protein
MTRGRTTPPSARPEAAPTTFTADGRPVVHGTVDTRQSVEARRGELRVLQIDPRGPPGELRVLQIDLRGPPGELRVPQIDLRGPPGELRVLEIDFEIDPRNSEFTPSGFEIDPRNSEFTPSGFEIDPRNSEFTELVFEIDPENSEFSKPVLKSIRRTPSSPAWFFRNRPSAAPRRGTAPAVRAERRSAKTRAHVSQRARLPAARPARITPRRWARRRRTHGERCARWGSSMRP